MNGSHLEGCPCEFLRAGVFRLNAAGTITYANPALASILGFSDSEALQGVLIATQFRDPEVFPTWIGELSTRTGSLRRTAQLHLLNGRERWASVLLHSLEDGYAGILQDVTLDLEQQSRQVLAEKMDAMGRLAAVMAHDFNNILAAISGYTDLILYSLDENNPIRADVTEIRAAGDRAVTLVSKLSSFSRRKANQPIPLDLPALVRETLPHIQQTLGPGIELQTEIATNPIMTEVDPSQIERILLLLSENARDAMPDGGVCRLELFSEQLDSTDAERLVHLQPGPHTVIRFQDQGPGIPADILSSIFDPFFSTRGKGKGTGLGLSIVYAAVRQNHGAIDIQSGPTTGTSIVLYFPVTG